MSSSPSSRVSRVRHELRRRRLTVRHIEALTLDYLRITFHSADLAGFTSLGFDDHVKLFFPSNEAGEPVMRDYTPQAFDPEKLELCIEFALHQPAGPATRWAQTARPGDSLEIGGPRGSFVLSDDFDAYLFIADETGFPAIRRRLGELRPDVPVQVLRLMADPAAPPIPLPIRAGLVEMVAPPNDAAVIAALAAVPRLGGEVHVWVAGEAAFVRALRPQLADRLGYDPRWIKAAAYWRQGEIGAHEVIAQGDGAEG